MYRSLIVALGLILCAQQALAVNTPTPTPTPTMVRLRLDSVATTPVTPKATWAVTPGCGTYEMRAPGDQNRGHISIWTVEDGE